MSVSDSDLELLDAHLDGELPAAESEELRVRLDVEPALAEALDALRAERGTRRLVWRSLEADDAAADRFAEGAIAASRNSARLARFNAVLARLKMATAAAACVAIGFSVGWLGRGEDLRRLGTGTPITMETEVGPGGPSIAVNQPTPGGPVEITLTDTSGQVLATQRFESPERAREFIYDLDRWQEQQQRLRDSQFIYTGGQF